MFEPSFKLARLIVLLMEQKTQYTEIKEKCT